MLEADRRLSRALIWQKQRGYFLHNRMAALSAWDAKLFKNCCERLIEQIVDDPAWFGDTVMALKAIEGQYLPLEVDDRVVAMLDELHWP